MDLFSVSTVAPHVAHHVAHAAPVAAPIIKTVLVGVTYMTAFIASGISLAAGFGLGWYIKGRGMAGVQIDINNIKTDIVNLKNKIDPSAPAPVSVSATA